MSTSDVSAYAGTVSVSYGLTNADTSSGRFARQFAATSRDGGKRFLAPTAVGPQIDYAYAAYAQGIFPGDYIGTACPAAGCTPCGPSRQAPPRRRRAIPPGPLRGVVRHHPRPPAAAAIDEESEVLAPDRRSLVLPPPGLDGQDLRASRSNHSARRRLAAGAPPHERARHQPPAARHPRHARGPRLRPVGTPTPKKPPAPPGSPSLAGPARTGLPPFEQVLAMSTPTHAVASR